MIYCAVSDLHVADDPAHRSRVAAHVEAASKLGRLLVAGDTIDAYTPERMEWACGHLPEDSICVPGNHSYSTPMQAGAFGTDDPAIYAWWDAWADGCMDRAWWSTDDVLQVDSCQRTGAFTSRGIHDEAGYNLAARLGAHADRNRYDPFDILLVHHDPRISSPSIDHPWLDWPMGEWIIKWAREHGIWAIVCGHVSMPLIECVDGLTVVNANDSLSSGKVAVIDTETRQVKEVRL